MAEAARVTRLTTLDEAAKALGLPRRAAQQRALTRGIGRVVRGVRVLDEDDVRELGREVRRGRPVSPPPVSRVVTEAAYQRAERAVEALREGATMGTPKR